VELPGRAMDKPCIQQGPRGAPHSARRQMAGQVNGRGEKLLHFTQKKTMPGKSSALLLPLKTTNPGIVKNQENGVSQGWGESRKRPFNTGRANIVKWKGRRGCIGGRDFVAPRYFLRVHACLESLKKKGNCILIFHWAATFSIREKMSRR